jgi:hypothetical protein
LKNKLKIVDNNSISLNYQCAGNKFDDKQQLSINTTVKSDSYPSHIHLCKERFSTSVLALISTSTTDQNNRTLHLSERDGRDFVTAYAKYTFYKFLTIVHIVEEAALGIVEKGTKIGKKHEAKQLADQLRTVKYFRENSNNKNNYSSTKRSNMYLYLYNGNILV